VPGGIDPCGSPVFDVLLSGYSDYSHIMYWDFKAVKLQHRGERNGYISALLEFKRLRLSLYIIISIVPCT
jgi:hypothetical protein